MSHGMHDDDDALAELIATLRGAAPEGEQLARLRRTVVSGSRGGRGGGGSGAWMLTLVLALTLGSAPSAAISSSEGAVSEAAVSPSARSGDATPAARATSTPRITPTPTSAPDTTSPPPATPVSAASPPAARRRGARARPVSPDAVTADLVEAPDAAAELLAFHRTLGELASPRAKSSTPSVALADALRAYAAGRCADAMPLLQQLLEGETDDGPATVERAELLLADCLARSGFEHSALALADAIARRGEAHTQHGEALELVGRLALRAPDPDALADTVGLYGEDRLVPLEGTPVRDVLVYLMARARYDAGEVGAAATLFARVTPGSRWYVTARYWEGMAHVRRRRARPAMDAFQAVIDDAGTARDGARGDRSHLRDLASIAIARVAYTAARPGRDGVDPERRATLLTRALEAWQRVDLGAAVGLDAFFEESWALYLLGENARALGHVHGLLSPQLEGRAHPEALVLRATIYYEHCRFDAAERAVTDFHQRYGALLEQVTARERALDDADAGYSLLDDVRSSRGPGGVLERALRAAFSDRALARQLARVRSIDAEIARVAAAPFHASSLGSRLSQELALARTLAVRRAGDGARARVARLGAELRARANEIDTIQLEIDTARRREAETGVPLTREPERPTRIVAVQGDQVWPFDGEYWEDELPYYREQISSICAR